MTSPADFKTNPDFDGLDYHSLNALLNIYKDGKIQFDADRRAAREYMIEHVNQNTVFFHTLQEKLEHLFEKGYYEQPVWDAYDFDFVKGLYQRAYGYKFRFPTFLGALKFFTSYALKTFDGSRYLERFEDRVVATALYLAQGDAAQATNLVDELMTGRFQPATPTFLNAGKAQRGELVSCFPAGTLIDTRMGRKAIESIEPGDYVLSHDGQYHSVTSVMSRTETEGLVTLTVAGSETLRLTPEHPVLVAGNEASIPELDGRDGASGELRWVAAKDIRKGDFVVAAAHRASHGVSKWVEGQPVFRVEAVSFEAGRHDVYNLEVEGTHTYVAQGHVVHNCFLLRVEDNMESIARGINASLQLSKRGGGVALLLSNLREAGAPIKQIENQSSGVVPVMKMLEDAFSYANQLGARQGAGAVYLSAHHPDIMRFLDTKRENADEKVRIKTLSLGVVIPDITFELAKNNEDMYLFSPYDVERIYGVPFADVPMSDHYREMVDDARIRKTKIKAREFFQTLAELQFESGYPYVVFEDTVNRANPIAGRINMSNLCSEILQVNTPSTFLENLNYDTIGRDISCNLGSLNIATTMDGGDLGRTVEIAVRALTAVSDLSDISAVPSVAEGNARSHAIGLGQMNLHGFLARESIHYDSPEAIDFVSAYFSAVAYHAIAASNAIARERGETFAGFEQSKYASGEYFQKYLTRSWQPQTERVQALFDKFGITVPTVADWEALRDAVAEHGIYNAYLQAVPPTGSISYINNSTSSIHPIASKIEIRKEGKLGRVYYPAPFMTDENLEFYRDAYEIGPEAIIDVYAAATEHVDQGLSLTLFFKDTATTRDVNRAQIYAWRKGIKTIYYIRIRQLALEGTEVEGCVSCML